MNDAASIIRPRTPAYADRVAAMVAADKAYTLACHDADAAGVDIYEDSACIEARAAYDALSAEFDAVDARREAHDAGIAAFIEACRLAGSTRLAEEDAALSIGREFLPAVALIVLDDTRRLTAEELTEYYDWLIAGVETAERENAESIAAGHEWHQEQS